MKLFIISLAAGMLVGVIYALLQVRSPAPPAVALIGLLGMLIGEQIVPIAKRAIAGEPITVSWFHAECSSKITGIETKKIVAQDLAERASHDEPHGLL